MGYTKRQFVEGAAEEIGMAQYIYDSPPEFLNAWGLRLDAMMEQWNGMVIRLAYPVSASPDDFDLDQATSVPNWANIGIICNLALQIAAMQGKIVRPETKINAFNGYNTIVGRSAMPPQMQLPGTMPAGAGNRGWGWGFAWNYVRPPVNQNVPIPEDDVTFSN